MIETMHLLIIGTVWPEPNSTAAGNRMMQLIRLFKEQNWKITFASSASESEFSENLTELNISKQQIELNNSSFDVFIKDLQPNMVVFDRFITEEQFGWRVQENCPNALRIIDTEDLHCLRAARQQAFKLKKEFGNTDLLSDTAKREIASILRCDLSLIISQFEMNLLQSFFKIDSSLLHYVPFLLNAIEEKNIEAWPKFSERNYFISIGNFLHEPNWNAVLYLKESIWPLIKKQLPKAELHVYGAYPSQKVFQLNNSNEGFLIKGRADNAHDVMQQAKVCLAPLRFGAGLKGKLIDAMQCGTPSVTTSIGAEAMHAHLPWNGFVEDNPETFANAAVQLYTNETVWENAQKNGINIINQNFSYQSHGSALIDRIKTVYSQLKAHREHNFIGSILNYQTHQATKYMSLWIEEKNKPKN